MTTLPLLCTATEFTAKSGPLPGSNPVSRLPALFSLRFSLSACVVVGTATGKADTNEPLIQALFGGVTDHMQWLARWGC